MGPNSSVRTLRCAEPVDGRRPLLRDPPAGPVRRLERLPYGLKVLLENLVRNEDRLRLSAEQAAALAQWDPSAEHTEVAFTPARVLMQDFTGSRAWSTWRPCAMRSPSWAGIRSDQPADARGVGDRPLGHRRRPRPRRRLPRSTPNWSSSATRAVPVAAWAQRRSPLRVVPQTPASAIRSTRSTCPGWCSPGGRRRTAPSGHAGGHRLAHPDGERPGGPGLGRRWHRGRGRHARPASR